MLAWIFSDLHVDANARTPWVLPDPRPDHDVVIIAGDICQGISRGANWIAEQGLNAKPVIYVPGNHEYYGFDFEAERTTGRAAAAELRNIHVLDRDTITIDGIAFLGATLWTDYRLFGEGSEAAAMLKAEQSMSDHRAIRYRDRRWMAADALAQHELSRRWLEDQLEIPGANSVVVTHAAPSFNSIAARYQHELLSAAFASNLDDLIARCTRLWVHGHTHIGCDYRHGACRVVNNPRGYCIAGEEEGFIPSLVCAL
jgi:predicted phosphodiesterase